MYSSANSLKTLNKAMPLKKRRFGVNFLVEFRAWWVFSFRQSSCSKPAILGFVQRNLRQKCCSQEIS